MVVFREPQVAVEANRDAAGETYSRSQWPHVGQGQENHSTLSNNRGLSRAKSLAWRWIWPFHHPQVQNLATISLTTVKAGQYLYVVAFPPQQRHGSVRCHTQRFV
jgi:hypothetical protein